MKLIEKIINKVVLLPLKVNPNNGEINNYNLGIKKLEQIADDYAIEFVEWCGLRTVQITKSEWANWLPNANGSLSTKELLEIFKKEKGL